jgi:hypothetical protein
MTPVVVLALANYPVPVESAAVRRPHLCACIYAWYCGMLMEHDPYDDMGPDPTRGLSGLEPVEVAPDYHAEISVPFTSEQLTAVSKIVREQGTSHGEVIRELLVEALAARETRR